MDINARHRAFWGPEFQETLANATLLVAGLGGLGATAAQILTRAGVGRLYLLDNGAVDEPDLGRQSLYFAEDLHAPKAAAAARRLRTLQGELVPLEQTIDEAFQAPPDLHGTLDCLDNFHSRFLLEQALPRGTFLVHGGVQGDYGQVISVLPGLSPTLREIYAGLSEPPPACPVTPDTVFALAALMARETLNHLKGNPVLLYRFCILEMTDLSVSYLGVK